MSKNEIPYKIYLNENEMPAYWYNLRADMKNKPAPLLNPGTHQPMTAEELSGVFCEDLVSIRKSSMTSILLVKVHRRILHFLVIPFLLSLRSAREVMCGVMPIMKSLVKETHLKVSSNCISIINRING